MFSVVRGRIRKEGSDTSSQLAFSSCLACGVASSFEPLGVEAQTCVCSDMKNSKEARALQEDWSLAFFGQQSPRALAGLACSCARAFFFLVTSVVLTLMTDVLPYPHRTQKCECPYVE